MTTKDKIERLFRTYYAALYRLAMLILRDDDVARDIVHDVFEALLVSGRIDVSETYLLAAVRNRCLKHIRSLSAQERMKTIYSVDEVAFNNKASKSLRLYFRWNQALTLEEVVERLNNFEQIKLTLKDKTIKVD